MKQVLFWIPLPGLEEGLPIYGFGTMLFITFLLSVWLASRRAEREGESKERLQDLAIWIFLGGIIGARIVYMIQYKQPLSAFFKIWEGGIVFYGSAIGGWLGYGLAYLFVYRKNPIPTWKYADIVAPSVALGLAIGRIGCLMNGCCFGHLAQSGMPGIEFPMLTAPARELLVGEGYQTAAGFGMSEHPGVDDRTVSAVEPGSAAEQAGLQAGDVIVAVDGQPVKSYVELSLALRELWPRGRDAVKLTIERDGKTITLPPFTPKSLPLHPTQLYETISMFLLFFALLAFYPLRQHHGQVFVLLMLCYAVHRFLNEQLRNDTDPVALGLTLSQLGSVLVFVSALVLELWLRASQPRLTRPQNEPTADAPQKVNVGG